MAKRKTVTIADCIVEAIDQSKFGKYVKEDKKNGRKGTID